MLFATSIFIFKEVTDPDIDISELQLWGWSERVTSSWLQFVWCNVKSAAQAVGLSADIQQTKHQYLSQCHRVGLYYNILRAV